MIAAQLCVGIGTQKKGIMCKPATQNNPQSWLCAFQNCTYFVMGVFEKLYLHSEIEKKGVFSHVFLR